MQLPPSLAHLTKTLAARSDWNPRDVVRAVRDSAVTAKDLEAWSDFEHPARDGYGRKMVFKDKHFEVMVMSWRPGDFASIHDHGHAMWGAVQIFGPAEHATFRVADERLSTLRRWTVQEGDIIGVSHSLIHQMGNPTKDERFLSLHVYGSPDVHDAVTGEARIYDLERGEVQRVDGGVFFELPPNDIVRIEPGVCGDFPSRLRYMVELMRRLDAMRVEGSPTRDAKSVYNDAFCTEHHEAFLECIANNTDEAGHQTNSVWWRSMGLETRAAAQLQREWEERDGESADTFRGYARVYDDLIGEACMNSFMRGYLEFVKKEFALDFSELDIISLGCGTGLVEEFMIKSLGARRERLLGIDHSPAMVEVAQERIRAQQGDVLALDGHREYDLAYSGLNVFHYLDSERLGEALMNAASVVRPGGHFVADFITPDHIRWYPNIVRSDDQRVISLRMPALMEDKGRMFQESSIMNISFRGEQIHFNDAGTHRRFLPPMHRVRQYLAAAFGTDPMIYDAHSLERVSPDADTCTSTRYVAVVQRAPTS